MAIDIRVIMLSPFRLRLPADPAARAIMTEAPDLSRSGACRAAHVDLMRDHGLPRTVPYLALTIALYPVGRRTKDA
jgi:hypothetical protein